MLFKQTHKNWMTLALILSTSTVFAQTGFEDWDTMDMAEITDELQPKAAQESPVLPQASSHNQPQIQQPATLADIVTQNPNKALDAAFNLVSKKMYTQAGTLFNILQKTFLNDAAMYGKGLILSQKGQFEDAYSTFLDITPQNFEQERIDEQLNIIALAQAQHYLAENNPQQAQQWLRRFIGNTATEEDRAQFSRTYTGLQTLENPVEAERLRVGILLPMSGPLKSIGQDVYKSAQMALFEQNIKSIFVYPHDTEGSTNTIEQATNNALKDGSQIFIGPLLAENTEVVSVMTRYQNTPIFSFSSKEEVANRNVFLLSYLPQEQAKRIATYAADSGVKKAAALVPNTPYGQLMLNAFSETAKDLDLELVRFASYTPGASDHTKALDILGQMDLSRENLKNEKLLLEQEYAVLGEAMEDVSLTRYKEIQTEDPSSIVDFDALYIASNAEDLPLLASQLAFYDMDASQIQLLGTGKWQSQELFKQKSDYTRGAAFPASGSPTEISAFTQRFEQMYGYTPHPLAILGYDAIQLLADIYNTDGAFVANYTDAITRREGFNLTSGPIRFNADGTPERVYNINKLRRSSSYTIEKAPKVMPPELPEPLNPMQKKASSVFNFFQGWDF